MSLVNAEAISSGMWDVQGWDGQNGEQTLSRRCLFRSIIDSGDMKSDVGEFYMVV